ncbi:MAG: hypothetical protein E4G99_10955 [Anaerolineales bacterium]|nr:MAG: hypothetical protein E4G99_10955 [Anaerolineales bacterium]
MMDSRSSVYGADALQRFLDQRPDLARDKKVVVFAYDVPYGLDATEISKIDLFYALYDSGPAFRDMAAKLLFFEQSAPGAAPVNIPGLGYELIDVTSPDPSQVIRLMLTPSEQEEPVEEPRGFMIGDSISFQTGVIIDSNGNPVPDRTPVEFQISSTAEGTLPAVIESATVHGVARASITIEQAGLLVIAAQSGRARVSETLQINAQLDAPAQATVISPTPIPTETSEPTRMPELATPTPASIESGSVAIGGSLSSRLGALVLGLLGAGMTSLVGYFTATRFREADDARLRYTLLPAICGLLAYNYLAFNFPGSIVVATALGGLSVFLVVLVGGAVGLLIAYVWSLRISP